MQIRKRTHAAVTIRSISGSQELDLFCRLPYVLNDELGPDLKAGRRRADWMWVALEGNRLAARAAWWSREGGDDAALLDVFDLDDDADEPRRIEIGVALLRRASRTVISSSAPPPAYIRIVPLDWRDDDVTRRRIEERMTALEHVGARMLVERVRFEWRRGMSLSLSTGRLSFRQPQDRAELVTLMSWALDATLDAHSRVALETRSSAQVAAEHYDSEFACYSSPRDWWRVATLPDGEAVGFVIPAHNGYNAIIAYIGVLPEHRGRGYVDDLLVEGTRILAATNVLRIRASTDLGNVPMAKAFERCGYVAYQGQIDMTWSSKGRRHLQGDSAGGESASALT